MFRVKTTNICVMDKRDEYFGWSPDVLSREKNGPEAICSRKIDTTRRKILYFDFPDVKHERTNYILVVYSAMVTQG